MSVPGVTESANWMSKLLLPVMSHTVSLKSAATSPSLPPGATICMPSLATAEPTTLTVVSALPSLSTNDRSLGSETVTVS